MDEALFRVLARLVQIRLELGDEWFEDAVGGALVAIGRSAMRAAELNGGPTNAHGDNVLQFPMRHRELWPDDLL